MVAGIAIAVLAAPITARSQDLSFSLTGQFSTGDYVFTERTNSFYLFTGLGVSGDRFSASASIPFIAQSTSLVTNTGGGMLPAGPTDGSGMDGGRMGRRGPGGRIPVSETVRETEVGIGDPFAHGSFELVRESGLLPSLRVTADLKVPIADVDDGFGTGEWDYAGGVSLAKSLAGTFLFVDASYWVLGDLPDLELQDPVYYSVGVGRPLSDRVSVLGSFSGYTDIIPDSDPPLQLDLGGFVRVTERRSVNVRLAVGLSESTPDLSVAIGTQLGL